MQTLGPGRDFPLCLLPQEQLDRLLTERLHLLPSCSDDHTSMLSELWVTAIQSEGPSSLGNLCDLEEHSLARKSTILSPN